MGTKQDALRQALREYADTHYDGRMYLLGASIGIRETQMSRYLNSLLLSERFITAVWRGLPDLAEEAKAALFEVTEERERRKAETRR